MTEAPTHRVSIAGTPEWFEVVEGERILTAARAAGYWLPFECGWGGCGTCKATVVEGETRLLFEGAPAVDVRDARRRRVVVCQSTPVTDVVLKPTRVSEQPPVERPTRDVRAVLESAVRLSEDVSRFRFETTTVVPFRPGQYANLELAPGLRRCYSIANLPGSHVLELVAKRYPGGVGSTRLFDLPVGSEIGLEAPYGDMWLRAESRPLLLIAGGTGISAILSLVRELSDRAAGRRGGDDREPDRVTVVYGARRLADLVCWDELRSRIEQIPRAELVGVLADPPPGWRGSTGLVTDVLEGLSAVAESEVYLAGPPGMVEAAKAGLRGAGVQLDRLFYDSFG